MAVVQEHNKIMAMKGTESARKTMWKIFKILGNYRYLYVSSLHTKKLLFEPFFSGFDLIPFFGFGNIFIEKGKSLNFFEEILH